jgi:hypothetical protein
VKKLRKTLQGKWVIPNMFVNSWYRRGGLGWKGLCDIPCQKIQKALKRFLFWHSKSSRDQCRIASMVSPALMTPMVSNQTDFFFVGSLSTIHPKPIWPSIQKKIKTLPNVSKRPLFDPPWPMSHCFYVQSALGCDIPIPTILGYHNLFYSHAGS